MRDVLWVPERTCPSCDVYWSREPRCWVCGSEGLFRPTSLATTDEERADETFRRLLTLRPSRRNPVTPTR